MIGSGIMFDLYGKGRLYGNGVIHGSRIEEVPSGEYVPHQGLPNAAYYKAESIDVCTNCEEEVCKHGNCKRIREVERSVSNKKHIWRAKRGKK